MQQLELRLLTPRAEVPVPRHILHKTCAWCGAQMHVRKDVEMCPNCDQAGGRSITSDEEIAGLVAAIEMNDPQA